MDEDLNTLVWNAAEPGEATSSNLPAPTQSGLLSGFMQQAVALGGQYLSKRIDIDLQSRLAGSMPDPYRIGTGQSLYGSTVMPQSGAFRPDATTRAVAAVGGMSLGNVLPFLAIGAVVLFMLKR